MIQEFIAKARHALLPDGTATDSDEPESKPDPHQIEIAQSEQRLAAAQDARAIAESNLQGAHDALAQDGELSKLEKALASAQQVEQRAARDLRAAQNRAAKAARDAQQNSGAALRKKLAAILAERAQAANAIDIAAQALADAIAVLQSHRNTINIAVAQHVIAHDVGDTLLLIDPQRAVELSLQHHGAMQGPHGAPASAELLERGSGVLRDALTVKEANER